MSTLRSAVIALALISAASAAAQDRMRTTDRVNLRKCPSIVSRKCLPIKTLPADTELELIRHTQEWLQVRVTATAETGWINAKFVTRPVQFDAELARRSVASERAWSLLVIILPVGLLYILTAVTVALWKQPRGHIAHLLLDWRTALSWVVLCVGGILGVIIVSSRHNSWMPVLTSWDYAKMTLTVAYFGWSLFWGAPPCLMLWAKAVLRLSVWLPVSIMGIFVSLLPVMIVTAIYSVLGGGIYHFAKRWRDALHVDDGKAAPPDSKLPVSAVSASP